VRGKKSKPARNGARTGCDFTVAHAHVVCTDSDHSLVFDLRLCPGCSGIRRAGAGLKGGKSSGTRTGYSRRGRGQPRRRLPCDKRQRRTTHLQIDQPVLAQRGDARQLHRPRKREERGAQQQRGDDVRTDARQQQTPG